MLDLAIDSLCFLSVTTWQHHRFPRKIGAVLTQIPLMRLHPSENPHLTSGRFILNPLPYHLLGGSSPGIPII